MCLACQAQTDSLPRPSSRMWELKKHTLRQQEKARQDSLMILWKRFVPGFTINLKSQFPIQQAIGIEIMTSSFISLYAGIGQFSRFYTLVALDALPGDTEQQDSRRQFLKDKLQNGFVFELGSYYHLVERKGLYAGANIQFQRFSMPSTPVELVEEYNFGDPDNFNEDIQDLINNNNLVRQFYESTEIAPTVRPIQLSFLVGKRFRFKNAPKLAFQVEFSYLLNIHTGTSVESPSTIGRILVNRFIDPILDNRSNDSFDGFNLPSVSFRLSYNVGKIMYKK